MKTRTSTIPDMSLLSGRLAKLAELDEGELESICAAECDQRHLHARRELIGEGEPIRARCAVLSGWAVRERILPDGQRQILGVLLPGDLVGLCQHSSALSSTAITAVTELTTCPVPPASPGSGLAEAYAQHAALETYYLIAHITRLGRLSAYERLADWLLETQDRLAAVNMSTADRYALPLTQEMLADTLGLTSVHVNRTLQALRRDGLLTLRGGTVAFPERDRLVEMVRYKPARVSVTG